MFDIIGTILFFLLGIIISSINCLLWDMFSGEDPFKTPYIDHFHWSIFSVSTGAFLAFFQEPLLAFLFLGYSLPLMFFEGDLQNITEMSKSLPLFILASYLTAHSLHTILIKTHIPLIFLGRASFILVLLTIPFTFIIALRNDLFEMEISETVLLNRYFWVQYVASTLYLILYLIFYIYDPAFRVGVFYGLMGIFTAFFIYALQRKLAEEEVKKVTEIFKPTQENISVFLNTLFMGAISTIIFVTFMVIAGIEKAAVTTITLKQAIVIEISPEIRATITYWWFEIASNWFLVAFGEETLCGLFVAIGYKIKGYKGMAAAIMLGEFWTLIHIIWKPYYLYLICLSALRAILTTLYFVQIKIFGTKFQQNILSCIMAHGINNTISILIAARII